MNSTISIIIATYNADKFLEQCLYSIIPQVTDNIEIIIIDGDSKDDTVEIIKKHQEHISYWISEPDKGIYDAWNKGIENASGNWIMFIGADDQLVPDAIQAYNQILISNSDIENIDFISCKVEMIDENGNSIRIKGWPHTWPLFLREMTVAHPGALHSKKLFLKYGNYNIDYKIVGDYELLLRAKDSLKSLFVDKIIVKMREGGASDSVKAIKEHFRAATSTGGGAKYSASLNFLLVYSKFKIKKLGRKLNLNLYLRK